MTTADQLFEEYKNRITPIIKQIKKEKEKAIPYVITVISTSIVPSMMSDIGRLKKTAGSDKKRLIIDTVNLIIDLIFDELDKDPKLAKETWDNDLKLTLLTLVGPIIDNLIDVENGDLTFNKKLKALCCK